MTGNVVFVGFAAAGAPGFSLSASLWALAGFLPGAHLGGHLIRPISDHRGPLFQVAVLIEIGSFNHGTMANALPHAIGAQASHPGRQVISPSGDGGLAMLLGELLTLRQRHLPVKVVVFNNDALSFVELEMKAAGIVTFATDLDNPDFAGIAQAIELFSARVEKADDLEGALQAAFAYDGPALVDVITDRQELSLPPKPTLEQVKGFALFATRTILSGQGNELVELAKTNLRQLDLE